MVRLMTAANAMQARIIAARLGSEGSVWELRGSVDGPLALGPVEVLVDAEGLATAREMLMVDDLESAFASEPHPVRELTARNVMWVALALVGLVLFAIARMTTTG
jgi:hypothetical protein